MQINANYGHFVAVWKLLELTGGAWMCSHPPCRLGDPRRERPQASTTATELSDPTPLYQRPLGAAETTPKEAHRP